MNNSKFVALAIVCLILVSCKKNSESLATNNIKMEVGVSSQADKDNTNIRVRLIDYSEGEPSYLTLPSWLALSGGDRLVVRTNNNEYNFSSLDDGNGIYSFDIPAVSPNVFGVVLTRPGGANAETGSIELFYKLSLDLPIDGTVFQSSDVIEARWSLNGIPPTEAVAGRQLQTTIKLANCVDAAGNIVLEHDPNRIPGAPFGSPLMNLDTLTASGKELLDLAVGPNILEASPSVTSCNVQLTFFADSYLTETGTDSLIEAYVDPTLALQEWTVRNQSNTVEVSILR